MHTDLDAGVGRHSADVIDMRPVKIGLDGPAVRMRKQRARLRLASWAFTTRRVPQGAACTILTAAGSPRAGDLVLARVDAIGLHSCLHMVNGRRRHLFGGDEIVVVYANRYASNQFESVVPETIGPCHLVAGGGIASRAISWHRRIWQGPTQITPLGLVGDTEERRLNVADFALPQVQIDAEHRPATIAVVGTSMDSGKTQTAVHLVRGLIAAGLRVGYAKVTGTGAGGDFWWLRDAGADPVLDFTDAGMPSTYLASPAEIENVLSVLTSNITNHGVDAMVLEIADGVLQQETAALLRSPLFARTAGGVLLAAQDSMSASAGANWLAREAPPLLGVSGILTAAPLQIAETVAATSLPVHDRESLATPEVAIALLGRAQRHLEESLGRQAGAA